MKEKVLKISACVILAITLVIATFVPTVKLVTANRLLSTAANRIYSEPHEGDIVIIDYEAVALAAGAETPDARCAIILDAINAERTKAGLSTLTRTSELAAAATVRAKEQEQLFSHTRPNGSDWWTVDSRVCYGENLARDYTTAEGVVAAWMASPTHKEVMLDDYKTCGIGVYVTSGGTTFIAAEFGY